MATRSLNKVMLIGNLTRDPELRYTPKGTAVCSFGLATNRQWTTDSGEKREEAEFHRIVAWNKLAELCAQLLTKGRKAFVEGRLQTRTWLGQDGTNRTTTETVIDNMIILDSRRMPGEEITPPAGGEAVAPAEKEGAPGAEVTPVAEESPSVGPQVAPTDTGKKKSAKGGSALGEKKPEATEGTGAKEEGKEEEKPEEEINPDDIPF